MGPLKERVNNIMCVYIYEFCCKFGLESILSISFENWRDFSGWPDYLAYSISPVLHYILAI